MLARFSYRHRQTEFRPKRGESNGEVLRLDFDRRLMLQFRGSVVTFDASFRAYREFDGGEPARENWPDAGSRSESGSGCVQRSRRPATLPETRRSLPRFD